jgi:2-amino-4-hydroxy-6-hydroxymethyldihydropteridine diphosphokinase
MGQKPPLIGPILIGIGANLPGADGASAFVMCQRAAMALDRLPGLRLRGLSRWYRSAPVPASAQPDFINAVAHLVGTADPSTLLAALHAIEAQAGRARDIVNAARPLDLDIIAMGHMVCATPDPILPHPRAHLRRFVLTPLNDVAPGWVHPTLGKTAAALLETLPSQDIIAL